MMCSKNKSVQVKLVGVCILVIDINAEKSTQFH